MRSPVFRGLAVFALILGVLPSLTVLSVHYESDFPSLATRTGPIGVLKFLAPFLGLFVVCGYRALRDTNEKRVFRVVAAAFVLGSVATAVAAIRCGLPSSFLREWAAISVGLLAGLAVRLLEERERDRVFLGWFAIVFLSAVLDLIFPSAIDWLFANVFDPNTRKNDISETGVRALAGVYGRQSMAKLMIWIPWLAVPALLRMAGALSERSRLFAVWIGLAVIAGITLATTQRGPVLAAFCALVAFGMHSFRKVPLRRRMAEIAVVVAIGLSTLFLAVPRQIIAPRILGTAAEPTAAAREVLEASESNIGFRERMTRASLASIAVSPFGNACIPESHFLEYGLKFATHSHHLFLEQFRSRGWIWGLLHLGLWLVGGVGFWRRRDLPSAAWFAGWVTIVVSGMFDHPWFVIHHAVVLGTYIVAGLASFLGSRKVD